MLNLLLSIIASYLLGSVQTAIILSKAVIHDDVRKYGSGSAGSTNMVRSFGAKMGVFTFLGDVAKAVIAVLLAQFVIGPLGGGGQELSLWCRAVAGIFVVVGHNWPVFYKFKGGKGVASTFGVALVTTPLVALLLLAVALLTAFLSKYMSLGSMLGVTLMALYGIGFLPLPLKLMFLVLMVMSLWQHRKNIVRLINKQENKIFTQPPEARKKGVK